MTVFAKVVRLVLRGLKQSCLSTESVAAAASALPSVEMTVFAKVVRLVLRGAETKLPFREIGRCGGFGRLLDKLSGGGGGGVVVVGGEDLEAGTGDELLVDQDDGAG